MPLKPHCFGIALWGLVFGFAIMLTAGKAEAQTTGRMELVCTGAGSAIKGDSSSAYFSDNWGNSASGTIYGTRRVGFDDEVSLWIEGDGGRIRMPAIMLPIFRGGEDGWFKLKSIKLTDREIIGSISVNPINNPKLRVDRFTGAISIAGKAGNFTGRCAGNTTAHGQSLAPSPQGPSGSYEAVAYLARSSPVPFAVDATLGTFVVTKIEAADTQLRMNVQTNDPGLSLADVASPANLQVICADPNFSQVLRLGGSIRLTFVSKNGALLGTTTKTGQLCGF